MTTEHWTTQNKGTLGTRSARHEVVEGVNCDGSKNLPTVVRMPDLSPQSYERALLIASAPKLLEALENWFVCADEHDTPCRCGRDKACAAIAQATGKDPITP